MSTAQQPAAPTPIVSGTLRAILKRSIAAWRDQPLIDVQQLPGELQVALRPLLRPGMRYLSQAQAHRMLQAACALLEDRERLVRRVIDLAKTAASIELAAEMIELVRPTMDFKALPAPDMTRLEAETRILERQLAELRRALLGAEEEV